MRILAAIFVCLMLAAPVAAQMQKRVPLTEVETDKIAEAGIDPNARVGLYMQFLNERADAIKKLAGRAHTDARAYRMSDALQDFSALEDELNDNLDVFAERKADIRDSLKKLNEAVARWQSVLHTVASEPGFDVAQKEALESGDDLADQAGKLLKDQTEYFKQHPDEVGQDRWEPR